MSTRPSAPGRCVLRASVRARAGTRAGPSSRPTGGAAALSDERSEEFAAARRPAQADPIRVARAQSEPRDASAGRGPRRRELPSNGLDFGFSAGRVDPARRMRTRRGHVAGGRRRPSALGAGPSRLLQPELREDLGVLLFHGEHLVAGLAGGGDGRAVLRLEVPAVAAEAAREVLVPDVVRVVAPFEVHVREDVPEVDGLDRIRGLLLGEVPRLPEPEVRSWVMSRIRKTDSKPEIALRKALWAAGVRGWRLRAKLPGTPDVVFSRVRLAVFVDGCFWHGCPHCAIPTPRSNRSYWEPKIERNKARDVRVRRKLNALGWSVLRLREHQIVRAPEGCARRVQRRIAAAASSAVCISTGSGSLPIITALVKRAI